MARAPHLRALTSLRFVAAFGVLLVHFGQSLLPWLPAFGDNFVAHGGNGVSFFFILSGFILTYTYGDRAEAGSLNLAEYAKSRFARIVPMYVFALALGTPLAVLHARATGLSLPPGYLAGFFATKLTITQSWYPPFVSSPAWIVAGWTLAVEATFYALFPFLVPILARLRRTTLVPAMITLVGLAWTGRAMVQGAIGGETGIVWAQCFPPLRVPEFALGIVLALAYRRGMIPSARTFTTLAYAGGALALVGLGGFEGLDTHPFALVITTGFALMILGFARAEGPLARWLASGPLVLLGEASYSLYLIHDPVGVVLNRVLQRLTGRGVHDSVAFFALYVATAVGASILCYRFIEEPARRRLRTARPEAPIPAESAA